MKVGSSVAQVAIWPRSSRSSTGQLFEGCTFVGDGALGTKWSGWVARATEHSRLSFNAAKLNTLRAPPREGLLRDRQDVPAWLPHNHPAEGAQRIPQQRRAMIPPHQRHLITLNVHKPVLVYLCDDGDNGRRLPHGVVEMDPVDEVAGAVRVAPIICAGKIPDIPRDEDSIVPSLHWRRSCPHRSVRAASSSEPPASVGLACRPVGACRRHLVKRVQFMRGQRRLSVTAGPVKYQSRW